MEKREKRRRSAAIKPVATGDHVEVLNVVDDDLQSQVDRLSLLYKIGIALSAERNTDRLFEVILQEAKTLTHADGGTLYIRDEEDRLHFMIMQTDSLGVRLGGTSGKPIELPPIPLHNADGSDNTANVASYAALLKASVNIEDAYDTTEFDFSGTRAFDERSGYHSRSFLTIPLVNSEDRVIGVLQLLNARDPLTDEVLAFRLEHQRIIEALASQAAIALDNKLLIDSQTDLLQSFIRLIANAIDAKSPYTGAHCQRVPIVAEMLARACCDVKDGPLAEFDLSEAEWEELRVAAWLHDCGKITTPVHVMDKATKLEGIYDRISEVRLRCELARKEAEIEYLRALWEDESNGEALHIALEAELRSIDDDLAFLERANVGSEFLSNKNKARIDAIAGRTVTIDGKRRPLLSDAEVEKLSISRGTLSDEERLIINDHMVQTIKMLEALPFPRDMSNVPEIASGHHERMDGKGYPRGIFAGDMSIPARIMCIADVFEALTAQDRPYKKGKTLSEAMRIMGFMKRDNHIDPELFDVFVRSGIYLEYGLKYLPEGQVDEVDVDDLLSVQPRTFEIPDVEERRERWRQFLPEYERRAKRGVATPKVDASVRRTRASMESLKVEKSD